MSALGGPGNLRSVDACTTRLRLEIVDQLKVDEAALRRLGAHGIVRPSATALQVVLGPIADQVAERIRRQLQSSRIATPSMPMAGAPNDAATSTRSSTSTTAGPSREIVNAFGGTTNVAELTPVAPTRLRIIVRDESCIDAQALERAAPRGSVRVAERTWHVIVKPD